MKTSFLQRGRWARPAITLTPRYLTPAEARRVHVLHLRRDAIKKQIAFIDAKIAALAREHGLTK